MRLKTKFNFMVIAGMAIPILFLGAIAYNISRNIIKNRISNELISSVENSINKIDRLLFERSISIEQWAGNSTFRTALDFRWGINKARDVMLDLKANSGGAVREIALVDKNGICFVSTDENHTENQTDWRETKWWRLSINGETYFNDWDLLDVEKNMAGVVFSTPIIKHIQDLNSMENYEYLGVLVLFIDWSTIENELKNIKKIFKEAGVNAFAFLLHNEKKEVIAHSDHRQYGSSITGIFPPEKIRLMKDKYAGLYSLDYQGEEHTICFIRDQGFQSYPGFNWTLVIGVRDSDLFRSLQYLFLTFFLIGIAAAVIALLVDLLFTHSVLTPLSFLAGKMNLVKKGDYTVRVSTDTGDEIEDLTRTFNDMVVGLEEKELIQAEKERIERDMEIIESELKVARKIQMSIVPSIFPAFPDRPEFDIYAVLEPAKEVGGDFYDFFLMDDNHLCFAIGDVSGKGVPAAFFMAVAKTLIKTKAHWGMGPDEILYTVNNELCQDNDSCMFATIFLCILNLQTGELVYSNGGHNLPYIFYNHGEIRQLAKTEGIALGIMEDAPFAKERIIFQGGDGIVLYTDGVTEAMDVNGGFLTDQRLEKALHRVKGASAEKINQCILDEIATFTAGAKQSDDITILVLKYESPGRLKQ